MSLPIRISLAVALALVLVLYGLRIKQLYANSLTLLETLSQFEREYFVGQPTNPQQLYVALGDSITQGTGVTQNTDTYSYRFAQAIAAQGYYVQVINYAQSGARAEDLLVKQLPKLAMLKADYITLTIGTNDATHFTNLKQYTDTMSQIVNELAKQSARRILLANSADATTFPSLPWLYSHAVGNRSKKQNVILDTLLRDKNSPIAVIDLYGEGKLDSKLNSDFYASDLFHPAKAGYDLWTKLFVDRLTR